MNISSIVVYARPEKLASVRSGIGRMPGAEVYVATEEGKLVVTIEAASDGETAGIFDLINAMDGVLSVAMVYHQFESDPENKVEVFVQADREVAP